MTALNQHPLKEGERDGVSWMTGHPREPATFEFRETLFTVPNHVRITKSFIAYDNHWPWWRRLWANLRGHHA